MAGEGCEFQHVVEDLARAGRSGVAPVVQPQALQPGLVAQLPELDAQRVRLDRDQPALAGPARAERWKRDQRIVRMVAAGRPKKEVAKAFSIAPTTVTHILGKHAPELKRGTGQ